MNLTQELALQWARKGVRVNSLCPGWFPSEMTARMETDQPVQAYVKNNSPIPRMGEAHELDGPLLLLAIGRRQLHDRPDARDRRRLDGALSPTRT